jgi:hypothetical protein
MRGRETETYKLKATLIKRSIKEAIMGGVNVARPIRELQYIVQS